MLNVLRLLVGLRRTNDMWLTVYYTEDTVHAQHPQQLLLSLHVIAIGLYRVVNFDFFESNSILSDKIEFAGNYVVHLKTHMSWSL